MLYHILGFAPGHARWDFHGPRLLSRGVDGIGSLAPPLQINELLVLSEWVRVHVCIRLEVVIASKLALKLYPSTLVVSTPDGLRSGPDRIVVGDL